MDSPENTSGGRPSPRRELNLQGPRPAPLKVRPDSHKIRKPPVPPQHQQLRAPPPQHQHRQQPVIIYAVSPKVVHVTVSDFMNLVQRLTGNASTSTSGAGDVSPAARLASIEHTSPGKRERIGGGYDMEGVVELSGTQEIMGGRQIPGILSPAPGDFPGILPGFFSPASDPQAGPWLHDMSSWFMPSPSSATFFSSPIVSPILSFDLLFSSDI